MRPIAEKLITKAVKGGVHNQRQVAPTSVTRTWPRLFAEVAPRYADRPGGYTRILKLGPRPGDNAPDGAHRVRLRWTAAQRRWRLDLA